MDHTAPKRSTGIVRLVEIFLFGTRWMLIPFYIGLIPVLAYYGVAYFNEIIHFIFSKDKVTIDIAKIFALDAIDIVMIANLITMIILGSYNSFVNKNHGYTNHNISSGQLKIKIATSVTVLSMINLLREFVSSTITGEQLTKQLVIFAAFLLASITIAYIEHLHSQDEHK